MWQKFFFFSFSFITLRVVFGSKSPVGLLILLSPMPATENRKCLYVVCCVDIRNKIKTKLEAGFVISYELRNYMHFTFFDGPIFVVTEN